MGETVGDQGFDAFGRVARQRIAHLDGRRLFVSAVFQYIGDVLARMLPSGKEQRDGPGAHQRYDAAGEGPRPLVIRLACLMNLVSPLGAGGTEESVESARDAA